MSDASLRSEGAPPGPGVKMDLVKDVYQVIVRFCLGESLNLGKMFQDGPAILGNTFIKSSLSKMGPANPRWTSLSPRKSGPPIDRCPYQLGAPGDQLGTNPAEVEGLSIYMFFSLVQGTKQYRTFSTWPLWSLCLSPLTGLSGLILGYQKVTFEGPGKYIIYTQKQLPHNLYSRN